MTHSMQVHSCFTVTQYMLGSPLQFEPAMGSRELDHMIDHYIPGHANLQQKRAQVVLEFLNFVDASTYPHPVSLHYRVTLDVTSSKRHQGGAAASVARTPTKSTTIVSRKRSCHEFAAKESDAKRLPGFSIMTKDGVDITDHASRGPKTKEQKEHAALMRKLKACGPCKRSKQRVCFN